MSRLVLAAPSKARAARPALPTIVPYDGPPVRYNQLTGVPLSMALLDQNYKEVMKPVMCKDYISDAIWSETTGRKAANIYGLSWEPGKLPIGEQTLIGLRFDQAEHAAKSKNLAALIDVWNKTLGFECELLDTTNPLEKILKLDKNWVAQPIRVSLLLLMARIGIAYRPGESLKDFFDDYGFDERLFWESDIGKTPKSNRAIDVLNDGDPPMVFGAKTRMLEIASNGKFPEQTWEQYELVDQCHARSGIVSYNPEEEERMRNRSRRINAHEANIFAAAGLKA